MGPVVHVAVSFGIGAAVWVGGGSPMSIPVAVAAGVLPDLDHLIDFLDSKDQGRRQHMLRPFHAWEYLIIASIVGLGFYSDGLFVVAVLGYLSHLAIDQLANQVHPLAYSLAYRASKGFHRRHLTPRLFQRRAELPQEQMPLWGRLEPSLWRLITRNRVKSDAPPR